MDVDQAVAIAETIQRSAVVVDAIAVASQAVGIQIARNYSARTSCWAEQKPTLEQQTRDQMNQDCEDCERNAEEFVVAVAAVASQEEHCKHSAEALFSTARRRDSMLADETCATIHAASLHDFE